MLLIEVSSDGRLDRHGSRSIFNLYIVMKSALKGQCSEILIMFLRYIDRPRPEYEPLPFLTFFSSPLRF